MPIAAAASSSGSHGEQNTDMDVVPELGGSVQARTERNAEEYGEFGAGAPAQSEVEDREEDDEFQRTSRCTPSARRSVKSTSYLDMCSTGRGVDTVQQREV